MRTPLYWPFVKGTISDEGPVMYKAFPCHGIINSDLQEGCKKVQCRSVVQAVKAICAVLCKIETIDIIHAVQKLQTVTIEKVG